MYVKFQQQKSQNMEMKNIEEPNTETIWRITVKVRHDKNSDNWTDSDKNFAFWTGMKPRLVPYLAISEAHGPYKGDACKTSVIFRYCWSKYTWVDVKLYNVYIVDIIPDLEQKYRFFNFQSHNP